MPLPILITIISALAVAGVYTGFQLSNNNSDHPLASDIMAPTLTAPTDVIVEATGPLTTVALTEPTIKDDTDPNPTLTYNGHSSDAYPLGTSSVTWTAEDTAGNIATAVQKVTVVDTTPPVIEAPADLVMYAGSSVFSMFVSPGTATVKDLVDGNPRVTNDAPSSGFPVGFTTVTWKAVDRSGNSATDTQLISVIVIEDDANKISNPSSSGGSSSGGGSSGSSGSDSSDESSSSTDEPVASSTYTRPFIATGSNFIDIEDDPSLRLDKFSLAAWFRTGHDYSHEKEVKSLIANKGGFGLEEAGKNMNYGIWIEGGSKDGNKIGAGFETSAGSDVVVMSSSKYNDGIWHYAVATYNLKVLKLYIDGELVADDSAKGAPDALGKQPLRIGANSLTDDKFFTGEIYEVNVWNRALTSSEVSKEYSSGELSEVEYAIPTIGGERPTNVKYGSTVRTVCDSGCTHTTIKSAIDSLPLGGGKVVLKAPDTFASGSTIALRSNLVIQFEKGAEMTYSGSGPVFSGKNINNVMFLNPVISRSDTGDVLFFSKANTIIVQGGKITGVKGSESSAFVCKNCVNVLVEGGTHSQFTRVLDIGTLGGEKGPTVSSNIWVEDVTASDASEICIKVNQVYDAHIYSNDVSQCTNNGIDVGFNVGSDVNGNTLTYVGKGSADFNGVGMHTDGAKTTIIRNNIIDHVGTGGISVCGSDNNYLIGNTISHAGEDPFRKGQGNAISVIKCASNTTIPEKTIIDSNRITDIPRTGIYVTQDATNVQITNNTFQNVLGANIFSNSEDTIIKGNIF